jgi:Kef-type K+ transport system membrane component KefB
VGAGLNSRGVVEVIVAMTGLQLHVLTQHLYPIVVLVAIVTSLMAPPLLRSWTGRTQCSVAEARRAGITGLEPALAARQAVRPDAEQGPG